MSASHDTTSAAASAAAKLLKYCQSHNWAGYDPYDGLNSELFRRYPILDRYFVRLGVTQLLKRSPVNVRSLLRVPPAENPKALALFLSAVLKMTKLGLASSALANELGEKILSSRSPDEEYWCWGYSFPWQTRTVLVNRAAPNLVCTVFVASALLDLYEQTDRRELLNVATDSAKYLLDRLYFTEPNDVASFAYPLPTAHAKVHNANLLAAALLARLYTFTNHEPYREVALNVVRYAVSRQNQDGSWYYGESPTQRWIDNFHTGYNLSALRTVAESLAAEELNQSIQRGFTFYRRHFVREDGAPRYFHDRTYPIDAHCVAQAIITLVEFSDIEPGSLRLARSVYNWAAENMLQDEGFFAYRVLRYVTIKISYMRWSQAWMLLAIATLLEHEMSRSFPGRVSHTEVPIA